jgi:hypothetical protein
LPTSSTLTSPSSSTPSVPAPFLPRLLQPVFTSPTRIYNKFIAPTYEKEQDESEEEGNYSRTSEQLNDDDDEDINPQIQRYEHNKQCDSSCHSLIMIET